MEREKITIIDGSSYFFRAFYAIQRLSNSKGFPTNAIFGFINMIMRVLEVEKPTKLAIAFDTPKPSFRKARYAEYKANREAPPEDLVKQIPHILRSVDAFGIWRFELEGFEADDVIATLAHRGVKDGFDIEIITGDKDLMQLVNDHVTLYDTMKDKRVNEAGVVERFGVKPDQITDFLALMGDSSDNIPGVAGIGEKTAAELIKQFGSLENLYARIDEIKQAKRKETLIKEKEIAFLSRELATVHTEVPIEFAWDELTYRGPVPEKLQPLLQEFEFNNLLKKFDFKRQEEDFQKGKYETIHTEVRLKALVEELKTRPIVSLDTETTSLVIHSAEIAGISLGGRAGEGFYIPMGHHVPGEPQTKLAGQLPPDLVREIVKPLLEDPRVSKVGQNLKFDIQILKRWGVEVKGVVSDTLLASYLLDPDQPHNLDALASRYLGHQNITYEEVTGTGRNQVLFSEVTIEKATEYSGEDVDVTFRLNEKLCPQLEELNLTRLYREVEVPLIEVLAEMEYRGVLVDRPRLENMGRELDAEIVTVQQKIYELAGETVNLNSPKQLSVLLFEKLGLPVIRKTKTGNSTDESVLMALSDKHEICRWLLRSRELTKLKSTYVEGLLAQIHPVTHRVHTNYNQIVTATGRLSSQNPNLQNIPTNTDPNYDIRSVFIPSPGFTLLSADYSQVELRLLADMSGDDVLVNAFKNNEDIHDVTARLIFNTETVSPAQRGVAKTINFGVIYGQTPYGLSQQLKISTSEAKTFIDAYFARYPKVKDFLSGLAASAHEKGYAETRLGRRRFLPEINSQNRMRREMAERAAVNAPIQGTAADMIKVAMVNLNRMLTQLKLQTRLILQVHDELVLEVPEGEKARAEELLREAMEGALRLKVPLKVEMGWGHTWSEC
jgi:DNA polymerase-1